MCLPDANVDRGKLMLGKAIVSLDPLRFPNAKRPHFTGVVTDSVALNLTVTALGEQCSQRCVVVHGGLTWR
jgi:hypothetical protein